MEKMDALASCVKGMRSADVDEEEQAMLDQLTQVLTKFKAAKALGDSTKSLPNNDLSAAGAVRPVPPNEAEQVMLDQLTSVITNYTALRALGDSTNTLPHDDRSTLQHEHGTHSSDVSITPLADAHRHRRSDFNSKLAASCPNLLRDHQQPDVNYIQVLEKVDFP